MDASTYKYRGFISYSHQDRRWGEWLHRSLEAYRVPARLVGSQGQHGPLPERLFPMFRDREELPTAGALGEALHLALRHSHSFVLVCSPAAAGSRWVNEEVLQFKRLGGESRILCLIVDGEPNAAEGPAPDRECFPPALRFQLGADGELTDIPAEPLAADAREGGDGRDNARLKIIAGLLGVNFGELRQRDLQARNRRLGLLAGITTAVAALTIALAVQAIFARRAAERSRQQGEDLIGFMLGDLRGKLEPLGKLEILDSVGDKAMGYFDQLDSGNLSEAAIAARAKALRQIGDVRVSQGRPAEAAEAFDAALALNQKLAARHPDNAGLQFELGQSEYYVGFAAFRANQLERAEQHWTSYQAVSQKLVLRDPGNAAWQLELAYSASNLGSLRVAANRNEAAIKEFQHAEEVAEQITPQTDETQYTVANSLSGQGDALQSLGRIPEAISAFEQKANLMRELSRRKPDDMRQRSRLADSLFALGYALISGGDASRALAVSDEGRALCKFMVNADNTNQNYRFSEAAHAYIRASALALQRRWTEAEVSNDNAEDLLNALREQDPLAFDYQRLQIRSRELAFNLALMQNQRTAAQALAASTIALAPCGNSQEKLLEEARIACARAHLLALEMTAGSPGDDLEEHRQAIDRMLDRVGGVGDTSSFDNLKAREQILLGQAELAKPIILSQWRGQYRPSDFALFLERHCDPVLGQAIGTSCIISRR